MPSQKRARKGQHPTETSGALAVYGTPSPMEISVPSFGNPLVKAEMEGPPSFMPGTPNGKQLNRSLSASANRSRLSFLQNPIPEEDDEIDDEEGDFEGGMGLSGSRDSKNDLKRPRLTADQVQSLERSFEEENRLEPERKRMLARQLGLRPRQVAVWFQNRRVRWKTKQMEKDYDGLKVALDSLIADYDLVRGDYTLLKADYEDLLHENAQLCAQFTHLNAKLVAANEAAKTNSPGATPLEAEQPFNETERMSPNGSCPSLMTTETETEANSMEQAHLQNSKLSFACEVSNDPIVDTVRDISDGIQDGVVITHEKRQNSPTSSGSDVTDVQSSQNSQKGSDVSSAPLMMLMRGSLSMDLDCKAEPHSPLPLPPLMELPETPNTEESQLWGSLTSNISMFEDEMCDNLHLLGDLGCTPWWEKGGV